MNDWHLRRAVQVLESGGIVLHATEGVWGLACDPWNRTAVMRLLAMKQRSVDKGLIVIGSDADSFAEELRQLDEAERRQIAASWPGPVTWIVPNCRFPDWISGGRSSVAVRVPGHPQARALSAAFGAPVVSTSANRAGRAAARNRFQARARLLELDRGDAAPLWLLPGETLGRAGPSEIRTIAGERLRGSG